MSEQGAPLDIDGAPPPTEAAKVELWCLEELLAAGYPLPHAERIAARFDVDLHQAVELAANGCEPRLATRILL